MVTDISFLMRHDLSLRNTCSALSRSFQHSHCLPSCSRWIALKYEMPSYATLLYSPSPSEDIILTRCRQLWSALTSYSSSCVSSTHTIHAAPMASAPTLRGSSCLQSHSPYPDSLAFPSSSESTQSTTDEQWLHISTWNCTGTTPQIIAWKLFYLTRSLVLIFVFIQCNRKRTFW